MTNSPTDPHQTLSIPRLQTPFTGLFRTHDNPNETPLLTVPLLQLLGDSKGVPVREKVKINLILACQLSPDATHTRPAILLMKPVDMAEWQVPTGYVDSTRDENLLEAIERVVKETTGLSVLDVGAYRLFDGEISAHVRVSGELKKLEGGGGFKWLEEEEVEGGKGFMEWFEYVFGVDGGGIRGGFPSDDRAASEEQEARLPDISTAVLAPSSLTDRDQISSAQTSADEVTKLEASLPLCELFLKYQTKGKTPLLNPIFLKVDQDESTAILMVQPHLTSPWQKRKYTIPSAAFADSTDTTLLEAAKRVAKSTFGLPVEIIDELNVDHSGDTLKFKVVILYTGGEIELGEAYAGYKWVKVAEGMDRWVRKWAGKHSLAFEEKIPALQRQLKELDTGREGFDASKKWELKGFSSPGQKQKLRETQSSKTRVAGHDVGLDKSLSELTALLKFTGKLIISLLFLKINADLTGSPEVLFCLRPLEDGGGWAAAINRTADYDPTITLMDAANRMAQSIVGLPVTEVKRVRVCKGPKTLQFNLAVVYSGGDVVLNDYYMDHKWRPLDKGFGGRIDQWFGEGGAAGFLKMVKDTEQVAVSPPQVAHPSTEIVPSRVDATNEVEHATTTEVKHDTCCLQMTDLDRPLSELQRLPSCQGKQMQLSLMLVMYEAGIGMSGMFLVGGAKTGTWVLPTAEINPGDDRSIVKAAQHMVEERYQLTFGQIAGFEESIDGNVWRISVVIPLVGATLDLGKVDFSYRWMVNQRLSQGINQWLRNDRSQSLVEQVNDLTTLMRRINLDQRKADQKYSSPAQMAIRPAPENRTPWNQGAQVQLADLKRPMSELMQQPAFKGKTIQIHLLHLLSDPRERESPILLIQQADDGFWSLPTGTVDPTIDRNIIHATGRVSKKVMNVAITDIVGWEACTGGDIVKMLILVPPPKNTPAVREFRWVMSKAMSTALQQWLKRCLKTSLLHEVDKLIQSMIDAETETAKKVKLIDTPGAKPATEAVSDQVVPDQVVSDRAVANQAVANPTVLPVAASDVHVDLYRPLDDLIQSSQNQGRKLLLSLFLTQPAPKGTAKPVLVIQKKPRTASQPAQWDVLGGFIDSGLGHTLLEAAQHLVKRKVNLALGKILEFEKADFDGLAHFSITAEVSGDVKLKEGYLDYRWIDRSTIGDTLVGWLGNVLEAEKRAEQRRVESTPSAEATKTQVEQTVKMPNDDMLVQGEPQLSDVHLPLTKLFFISTYRDKKLIFSLVLHRPLAEDPHRSIVMVQRAKRPKDGLGDAQWDLIQGAVTIEDNSIFEAAQRLAQHRLGLVIENVTDLTGREFDGTLYLNILAEVSGEVKLDKGYEGYRWVNNQNKGTIPEDLLKGVQLHKLNDRAVASAPQHSNQVPETTGIQEMEAEAQVQTQPDQSSPVVPPDTVQESCKPCEFNPSLVHKDLAHFSLPLMELVELPSFKNQEFVVNLIVFRRSPNGESILLLQSASDSQKGRLRCPEGPTNAQDQNLLDTVTRVLTETTSLRPKQIRKTSPSIKGRGTRRFNFLVEVDADAQPTLVEAKYCAAKWVSRHDLVEFGSELRGFCGSVFDDLEHNECPVPDSTGLEEQKITSIIDTQASKVPQEIAHLSLPLAKLSEFPSFKDQKFEISLVLTRESHSNPEILLVQTPSDIQKNNWQCPEGSTKTSDHTLLDTVFRLIKEVTSLTVKEIKNYQHVLETPGTRHFRFSVLVEGGVVLDKSRYAAAKWVGRNELDGVVPGLKWFSDFILGDLADATRMEDVSGEGVDGDLVPAEGIQEKSSGKLATVLEEEAD